MTRETAERVFGRLDKLGASCTLRRRSGMDTYEVDLSVTWLSEPEHLIELADLVVNAEAKIRPEPLAGELVVT